MSSALSLSAGNLLFEIKHQFDGKPLFLNSLKYEISETFSVTRLSYLLSDFGIQKNDGVWVDLENQFAYVDLGKRRTGFSVSGVPEGEYKSIRFSLGVPREINNGDSTKFPEGHPLNPNVNQLHWDLTGGYIFMALEGKYRSDEKSIDGFVYHLANDNNFTRVQLAVDFRVKKTTAVELALDVKNLLGHPRALSFQKDGNSTHSRPGDVVASGLVANLQSAFGFLGISYPLSEIPQEKVIPLYLPESYTAFALKTNSRFPKPALPRDNPLLKERVDLGERLFHDGRLSRNGSVSCASCHQQDKAFTDGRRFSVGVEGRVGTRNSMPLFNLAWKSSFFWDGRANSLREQALIPIEDHLEMDEDLDRVVEKLKKDPSYQNSFAKAFSENEITAEKIGLALENFLLTLTSYDSKFDRAMVETTELSDEEQRGMQLFFTEYEPRTQQYGADCFHCHGGANFSDHQFHNNGLFTGKDLGRFLITEEDRDRYVFATPSLRNVAVTAPYMHDGRFKTLEEVIEHYSGPMNQSDTLDPNLAKHPQLGLQLNVDDKSALVAFLKTLTDPKFEK